MCFFQLKQWVAVCGPLEGHFKEFIFQQQFHNPFLCGSIFDLPGKNYWWVHQLFY